LGKLATSGDLAGLTMEDLGDECFGSDVNADAE
jgi:hypothetical protein